ncbi:hypothetical protein EIP86_006229 [Pleurotus ostreatoroseus]|nr:hypothetical protein EIP86_006229 [Pleurotus ostreatoroseus]
MDSHSSRIPDTVDTSVRDFKAFDPLLRPRTHPFHVKDLCQILTSNSMKSLPRHFMPTNSLEKIQPPLMLYGWELAEEKLLAYAKEIGLQSFSTYACERQELEGRNVDPVDVTELHDVISPDTVRVRTFSPIRTMEALFDFYLDELDINTCLIHPVRAVHTADGYTTHIYAFYSNYHCEDAPTKKELEELHWAMEEFDLSREMKWWFSIEDPHWRSPLDPAPLL